MEFLKFLKTNTNEYLTMNTTKLTKILSTFFGAALIGYAGILQAHSAGAVLGAAGDNPSASALAEVTCGAGSSHLFADIEDLSQPEFGAYINLLLYKGTQTIGISDPEPGDGQPSPSISLQGGTGTYRMFLSKTNASPRAFEVTWHCEAADGTHTDTDIVVRQFQ